MSPQEPGARTQKQITLSHKAETYLCKLADNMAAGNVELWQLPPSLLGLYTYAFEDGRHSVLPQLARTQDDADKWYARAMNPGKKLAELRRREMDAAAEDYWEQFIGGAK